MRDFPYLRLGIRDFKAKSGRDSGLKVCAGGGIPKVTLGITGLPELLGQDHGIEKPYWGPSVHNQWVPVQLKMFGYLCNQTVNLETDAKSLYYSLLKLKYSPSIYLKHKKD